ncbi:ESX secretion-associated protein EspG [Nocardia iowensis]|uniref:ESX secretion-associated protein EspG n=1 Tax=Nocardia iowensis TaxID=204891 RepID=A0ABX8RV43_NOCIO|nr:ESX secretion-associated protein EspG [Nocardia iowensis]QXN92862.1 ESX secretion-associated protein EspG [Nocardia iowensis]
MTESRWRLNGLMFELALAALGRDRLPYPLRYTIEGVQAYEDYERLRTNAAQQLSSFAGPDLFNALKVLLEPQVRVEVHGFFGRDFGQVVRVHAGMTARAATIAVQLPGPTQEYGRDILLTRCPPQAVPGQIAANLPNCVGGRYPAISGRRSDLDRVEYAKHPTRLSHTEQLNRIVRRPRSGLGEIGVFAGGAIDSRPTTDGRGFHWMDYLPADGRYLLHHHGDDEFTLTPGPVGEIQRQLHALIETTYRSAAPSW